MSYFRKTLALSGIQSQPAGGRVARGALSGLQSQPAGGRVFRGSLGSLGDDTLETRNFQQELLQQTKAIQEHELARIRKEEIRGYLQIAATLSIPVMAAVWKMLGIGKKKTVL